MISDLAAAMGLRMIFDENCPKGVMFAMPQIEEDGEWLLDAENAVALRITKPRPMPPREVDHGSRNDRDARNLREW